MVKCHRLKYNIAEIPAQWEERSVGESKFKIFKWLPQYLKWYIYGFETIGLSNLKYEKKILVTGEVVLSGQL